MECNSHLGGSGQKRPEPHRGRTSQRHRTQHEVCTTGGQHIIWKYLAVRPEAPEALTPPNVWWSILLRKTLHSKMDTTVVCLNMFEHSWEKGTSANFAAATVDAAWCCYSLNSSLRSVRIFQSQQHAELPPCIVYTWNIMQLSGV